MTTSNANLSGSVLSMESAAAAAETDFHSSKWDFLVSF